MSLHAARLGRAISEMSVGSFEDWGGKELADHQRSSLATDIDVYFCDPQSPWQRGSNENTNSLLRQYFPKGTDLSVYSQAHLNKVARRCCHGNWLVSAAGGE